MRRATAWIVTLLFVAAGCSPTASPTATASGVAAAPSGGPSASGGDPNPSVDAGEPAGPTSIDLIRAALSAGTIDPQTAMRYRVYAMFGALELPEEFRSAHWVEDSALLDLAASRLDKLSPETADAIRPFLVRPADPSSVFFAAPPEASVLLASTTLGRSLTAALTCGANGWASATGQNNFRVWGRCGPGFVDSDLEQVAGWLDTLWDAESTYMGRQPLSDVGGPDEGGDRAVDFYLVTSCVTRAGSCRSHTGLAATRLAPPFNGPAGAYNGSGYVVMNRAYVADPEGPATVAHELFHVLQHAFNWEALSSGGDSHWFVEASATWAEYRFVGDPTATPTRFLGYQGTSYPLQDTTGGNDYRSFVWPLFMEEAGGDGTVAAAWAAIAGQTTISLVTDAIDARLPFKTRFRDFAVRDWNDPAMDDAIGPLFPTGAVGSGRLQPLSPRRASDLTLPANRSGSPPDLVEASIRSLAVLFKRLTVNPDVGQVTLDFAGLQPRSSVDVDLLLNIEGKGWEREEVVDDKIQFCRDVPAERVTEIIVVLANHEKDPTSNVVGDWTAESLKDECPKNLLGDITSSSKSVYVDPTGAEHPRYASLAVHVVIEVGDGGTLYVARGSTFSYTADDPEGCQTHIEGHGGLGPPVWMAPQPNADPHATGHAVVGGGGPGATEMDIDVNIPTPEGACEGGWLQTFSFTLNADGIWIHDRPYRKSDTAAGWYESESHGSLSEAISGP